MILCNIVSVLSHFLTLYPSYAGNNTLCFQSYVYANLYCINTSVLKVLLALENKKDECK